MDLDKMFLKTFLKNFNDIPFTIRFADGEEMVLGTEPSKFKLILTIYDKILFIMRLFENEETGDDFFEKQLD